MATIILTRGIQGSGKSTWARRWVRENPSQRIRWNNDDYRMMIGPYRISNDIEKLIKKCRLYTILFAIQNNYDIVVDCMNIDKDVQLQSIISFLNQHDISNESYNIVFKEFNTPVDTCIQRDLYRKQTGGNYIGEKVIIDTYNRYINYNNKHNIQQSNGE